VVIILQVTQFWRCDQKNDGCKVRLHENGGTVILEMGRHVHRPNPGRLEALKAVTAMKRRAEETEESTSCVISTQLQRISQEAHGSLPSADALKRRVRRVRQRTGAALPNPTSLSTLVIPEKYRQYAPSPGVIENFLLFDSGPSADRILIFSRPRSTEVGIGSEHVTEKY